MIGSSYLTATSSAQLDTYPGQAHFACDLNHTCRECEHWANPERTKAGKLTIGRCRKALWRLPKVPHHAKACRYFAVNRSAPSV